MKRLLLITVFLAAIMAFFSHIKFSGTDQLMAESMMALGFTLIFAYLVGIIVTRIQLPKITGYILAGILVGPHFMNLISKPVVHNLQLIDNIALSLIALTAGGEFKYRQMKGQLKTINIVIILQIVIVIIGFMAFTILYKNQISFIKDSPFSAALGVGLILGAIAIAKSPATTIAIITEMRARGRFTDFVLGVTVFKDIVVVLVFSVALSVARPLLIPTSHLEIYYILEVVKEILFSIIAGLSAGAVILLYIRQIKKQISLFLLGFMILGIEMSHMFHLEFILIFMVAGFFVQNFSREGDKLIHGLEESSLPIFVTFFAIAGASLNFPVFLNNWSLALLVVILRMLTTWGGTYAGGKLTGASNQVTNYGWMGFVGQAGLSLGLSILVKQNIPGEIGLSIATIIVASITINQIIGPVLFKYSLVKVGEIQTMPAN